MDFEFPYPPYRVQLELMNEIYQTLSTCRGGIFESPTGTGKSLSIICSSFKWLKETQAYATQSSKSVQTQDIKDSTPYEEFKDEDNVPMKRKRNDTDLPPNKAMKISNSQIIGRMSIYEEPYIGSPEDPYQYSDPSSEYYDLRTQDLSMKPMQIIYASRTHSQLSQFMNEVKKTKYGEPETQMKIVQLASRSYLCINKSVKQASNFREINDKCKECVNNTLKLLNHPQMDISYENTCFYYNNRQTMTGEILSNLIDIEEMSLLGKKHRSCPYYGMKEAIKFADVILSPYINVLHRRQRQRLGLDLQNTVLIVDEAHNLVESILDAYSNTISSLQIQKLIKDLTKFTSNTKLISEKHGLYKVLLRNLERISRLTEAVLRSNASSQFFNMSKFLTEANMNKKDLKDLVYRIEKLDKNNTSSKEDEESTELYIALDFISSLTENEEDGKILLDISQDRVSIQFKYVLLNPIKPFKEVLNSCNCVILLGGTLEPKEEFLELFEGIQSNKLRIYSCSHVISPQNLLVASISKGPATQSLSFTFANRLNRNMLNDLSNTLIDVCSAVPNGIVIFFPSYSYMQSVIKHFHSNNAIQRIKALKSIFYDDKGDKVFPLYSEEARKGGAVLFTVVRGKLSEGINFNDELGRCVIMIGLPYPNSQDIELQEKMKFWDQKGGRMTGRMLYDNMCHKAVNQSIGRAIRHKEDYAVVLLVDMRYDTCWQKRPSWTLNNKLSNTSYEETRYRIIEFFSNKHLSTIY